MRKYVLISLFIMSSGFANDFSTKKDYSVCFTPSKISEDCTHKIVGAIANAKRQILVQAYSFTSVPIAQALAKAEKEGVDVEVILDKSQRKAKSSSYSYLKEQGIPIKIDYRPAIAHNKVMVLDKETVITGSFNFTKAAQEKNAENLLIINNKGLAKEYITNWVSREKVSSVL